jgi:hypothetical protein
MTDTLNAFNALRYVRNRLGSNTPRLSPITDPDGRVNGYTLRVGVSRLVIVGHEVDTDRVSLFIDGILYARYKRDIKRTTKAAREQREAEREEERRRMILQDGDAS